LCGLDNGLGRQALDQVGFDFVVEAGLGRGHRDFRAVHLHTLPASRPASQIWRGAQTHDQVDDRPAYQGLLARGALDRCGVTLLAGKAVGAPSRGMRAQRGSSRTRWRCSQSCTNYSPAEQRRLQGLHGLSRRGKR